MMLCPVIIKILCYAGVVEIQYTGTDWDGRVEGVGVNHMMHLIINNCAIL